MKKVIPTLWGWRILILRLRKLTEDEEIDRCDPDRRPD
jgi:hypothetical protein